METNQKKINLFGVDYEISIEHEGLTAIKELESFLPPMDEEQFNKLKDDIKERGLLDPILFIRFQDGTRLVIDGHNRLRADLIVNHDILGTEYKKVAMKTEIREKFESMEDIKLWMVKHQFNRRNLTNTQKLEIAFKSKDVITEKAKQNLKKAGTGEEVVDHIDTDLEIAKLADVCKSTVSHYSKIMRDGNDEIKRELHNGEISINEAYNRTKDEIQSERKKTAKAANATAKRNNPFITDSIEAGKELLNDEKVSALVLIHNTQDLNMFNNSQLSKFGFVILN